MREHGHVERQPVPVPQLLRPRTTRGRSSTACRSRSPRGDAGASARITSQSAITIDLATRPLRSTRKFARHLGTTVVGRCGSRRELQFHRRTIRSIAVGHGIAVLARCCSRRTQAAARSAQAITDRHRSRWSLALTRARRRVCPFGVPRSSPSAVIAVAAACALLAVTLRGVITLPIAALLGIGIGIAMPDVDGLDRRIVGLGVAAGAARVDCVRAHRRTHRRACGARRSSAWPSVSCRSPSSPREHAELGRVGIALVTRDSRCWRPGSWRGSAPTIRPWSGSATSSRTAIARSHAWRSPSTTGRTIRTPMSVAGILDSHGVKGTFFEVGKAIDARPDITRALLADGQLVANHSYHHDYWRWLDPRYPELDRTQQAFERALGKCPAFFRPPHGQRTPFMLAQVRARGHACRDLGHVGRGLVRAQRQRSWPTGSWMAPSPAPSSCLHDGLDGNVHADRSVLLTALPLIIDGLRAKGLDPVRLDDLLGLPGYLDRC